MAGRAVDEALDERALESVIPLEAGEVSEVRVDRAGMRELPVEESHDAAVGGVDEDVLRVEVAVCEHHPLLVLTVVQRALGEIDQRPQVEPVRLSPRGKPAVIPEVLCPGVEIGRHSFAGEGEISVREGAVPQEGDAGQCTQNSAEVVAEGLPVQRRRILP